MTAVKTATRVLGTASKSASSYSGLALPKPEPRQRTKARKKRQEANADRAVYTEVHRRDGGLCRVCGIFCGQSIHLHHVIYRSQGGPTTVENLLSVCRRCHEGIHARRVIVQDAADARHEEQR